MSVAQETQHMLLHAYGRVQTLKNEVSRLYRVMLSVHTLLRCIRFQESKQGSQFVWIAPSTCGRTIKNMPYNKKKVTKLIQQEINWICNPQLLQSINNSLAQKTWKCSDSSLAPSVLACKPQPSLFWKNNSPLTHAKWKSLNSRLASSLRISSSGLANFREWNSVTVSNFWVKQHLRNGVRLNSILRELKDL